jgi:hypothetical protein
MPEITTRKIFLIACIAGLAMAVVSIGHAEKANTIVQTHDAATASRTALSMCPSAQGQMSKPVGPIYKRYLGHTPMSHMAVR